MGDEPELITLHRYDVEDIALILGELEDALLHLDDEYALDVTEFLPYSSPEYRARWVGELARHLRDQLFPTHQCRPNIGP